MALDLDPTQRYYLIEYSQSSKSPCADPECIRKLISSHSIRIGMQSAEIDGYSFIQWFHSDCFFALQNRTEGSIWYKDWNKVSNTDELKGFHHLSPIDRVAIELLLKSTATTVTITDTDNNTLSPNSAGTGNSSRKRSSPNIKPQLSPTSPVSPIADNTNIGRSGKSRKAFASTEISDAATASVLAAAKNENNNSNDNNNTSETDEKKNCLIM